MKLSMDYIGNNIKRWCHTPIQNKDFLNELKRKYEIDDYKAAVILSNALYEEHNSSKDKDIKITALQNWLSEARKKANFYNKKYIENTYPYLREIAELKGRLKQAQTKLKLALAMLEMSEGKLQVQYLRHGGKIARKEGATKELIEQLSNEGLSVTEISKQLNVSKSTIYRRLHEENPTESLEKDTKKKFDSPFED